MTDLPKHSPQVRWRNTMLLAAALFSVSVPAAAQPVPTSSSELRAEIADRAGSDLREFYRARAGRPLWVGGDGSLGSAAYELLKLLETSQLDGLNPKKLKVRNLASAMRKAEQKPTADNLAKAEIVLSRTFAAYVQALRQQHHAPMIYVSRDLAPVVPTTPAVLQSAAAAASLGEYVARMGWMHPLYGELRHAMTADTFDRDRFAVMFANLQRLRGIPAQPAPRYVLVDAAGARLWMYENGRAVGSMKVVVGTADNQTPMIAGYLRNAILNPYWNVPVDLAQSRIATNVLDKGVGYLKAGRYQVMSDWTAKAKPVDPKTIDWRAVADGVHEVRVRQLPGGENFMGKVKFEFPNDLGIYLHDTPDKGLMREDLRQFSSGCVRLEDAQRFGRWLLGKPLPRGVKALEHRVDLPEAVPVYITYLTAMPVNGRIAFNPDLYGHDRTFLAADGARGSRSR